MGGVSLLMMKTSATTTSTTSVSGGGLLLPFLLLLVLMLNTREVVGFSSNTRRSTPFPITTTTTTRRQPISSINQFNTIRQVYHYSSPGAAISSSSSNVFSRTTFLRASNNKNDDDPRTTTIQQSSDTDEEKEPNWLEKFMAMFSTRVASKVSKKYNRDIAPITQKLGLLTMIRVGVPSLLSGIVAFYAFPGLAIQLCSVWNDAGVFAVLSQDSSQFVQNFLTVAGLLFSILVGQTYYFMYQQQEMVALVCQGRTMYPKVLSAISQYVQTDLKKLQADPAILLSARPVDDPLETIMYLTSVGVPSTVYETVRSLRQARAQRLGALQRKLPTVHMFPIVGSGDTNHWWIQPIDSRGVPVVTELWRPAGGAYNVDNVLKVMVRGLEQELKARMEGKAIQNMKGVFPSLPNNNKRRNKVIDAEYLGKANDQIKLNNNNNNNNN
eukprot:scaffold17595_cov113-Cylindrotheca_fusiformis.AAC.1